MNIRLALMVSAIALSTLAAASSHAAILLRDTSASSARTDNTAFDETFMSLGSGPANLSFLINGFGSLDGQNFYEDDFTLALNGVAILSGTFNLGGGGSDLVFFAPIGATVSNVSGHGVAVTWTGGQVNVATPLTLGVGANILTFGYTSLTSGHAGAQSLSDEGWDASDITVTQANPLSLAAIVVPEPSGWALMLLGFAGAGAMLRSRRRAKLASARL